MSERNNAMSLPDFEDRLWAELTALHPGATAGRRSRRQRGRHWYLAAAAVALLVGVAGMAVALTRSGESAGPADVATERGADEGAGLPGSDGSPGEGQGDEGADDGVVPDDRVPPANAIVYVEQLNDDGSAVRRWTDEANGLSRDLQLDAAGNPVYDSGWLSMEPGVACEPVYNPPPPDGCTRITQASVDHSQGTYSENEMVMPGVISDNDNLREDHHIVTGLENGTLRVDGTEQAGGRELLRLLDVLAGGCTRANGATTGPAAGGVTATTVMPGGEPPEGCEEEFVNGVVWVDPETFRPVKRLGYPDRTDVDFNAGPEAGVYTQTFEYLERTPENLEQLQVEIPEGFVELPAQ